MSIEAIAKALKADSTQKFAKHSRIAHLLIKQEPVKEAVAKKLKKKFKLIKVSEIEYHFKTGLVFTCFQFEPSDSLIDACDLLVMSDGNCQVVSVIESFNSRQPNPHVPPLPELKPLPDDEEVPFAVERPHFDGTIGIPAARKFALQIRSAEFFNRLNLPQNNEDGGQTQSTYETSRGTNRACLERTATGPWGSPDICDRWEEQETVTNDTSNDDSQT